MGEIRPGLRLPEPRPERRRIETLALQETSQERRTADPPLLIGEARSFRRMPKALRR